MKVRRLAATACLPWWGRRCACYSARATLIASLHRYSAVCSPSTSEMLASYLSRRPAALLAASARSMSATPVSYLRTLTNLRSVSRAQPAARSARVVSFYAPVHRRPVLAGSDLEPLAAAVRRECSWRVWALHPLKRGCRLAHGHNRARLTRTSRPCAVQNYMPKTGPEASKWAPPRARDAPQRGDFNPPAGQFARRTASSRSHTRLAPSLPPRSEVEPRFLEMVKMNFDKAGAWGGVPTWRPSSRVEDGRSNVLSPPPLFLTHPTLAPLRSGPHGH